MPISVTCKSCGKKLKAGDALVGKTLPCPNCKQPVAIAAADADVEDAPTYVVKAEAAPPRAPVEPSYEVSAPAEPDSEEETPRPRRRKKKRKRELATAGATPFWLRHLHWLLALALIPLAISLLQAEDRDVEAQLDETLAQLPPETRRRAELILGQLEQGEGSEDELFKLLPGHRLVGAFLPHDSWAHWGFAAGATVLFLGFCIFLALDRSASSVHLLLVGGFTATVGIVLLLGLQLAADSTQGVWFRGRGVIIVAFYIIKLIGFSYNAALDPENGFVLSFIGFTLGVGFCEEVCKLLPVLARYWRPRGTFSWRNAFLWGLASGAGFGIAEGIIYSSNHYNGIHGPGIYVVRFISCVALHAVWTASAAIMVHVRHDLISSLDMAWYELFLPIVVYVGVPAVLHGLYDTLLKKEMNAGALIVALLSFGFLAVQIYWLRGSDDAEATEEMLEEYQRRKLARG